MRLLNEARQIAPELELRDYQERVTSGVAQNYGKGDRGIMVYSPTGSGKTEVAIGLIKRIWSSGKVLPINTRPYFIVDRKTLCWQAVERMEGMGMVVSVMQGDNTMIRPNADVVVATVQTLASRFGEKDDLQREMPRDMGMAIVDEAHLLHHFHKQIRKRLDGILMVGLSATPLRHELGTYYQSMVKGPSLRECIKHGWLVPPRCFGPSEPDLSDVSKGTRATGRDYIDSELSDVMRTITGDIVATWKRLGSGYKTICFCVDIAHCEEVAADFRGDGVSAEALHSKMSDDDRDAAIKQFKAGEIQILVAVMILATGFDCPAADCAILARPTLSESLHYQQLGRVLRRHEGKDHALVLDHAGNMARFGNPVDFEVDELDESELKKRAKRKSLDGIKEMAPCLECSYMLLPEETECPECGHSRKRPSYIAVVDGELVNMSTPDGQDRRMEIDGIAARKSFYAQVMHFAISRGMSNPGGFAYHKAIAKFPDAPKPPWAWRDIEPKVPTPTTTRWLNNQYTRDRIAQRKAKENAAPKPTPIKVCPKCGISGVMAECDTGGGGVQYRVRCPQCRKSLSQALPHHEVDSGATVRM